MMYGPFEVDACAMVKVTMRTLLEPRRLLFKAFLGTDVGLV